MSDTSLCSSVAAVISLGVDAPGTSSTQPIHQSPSRFRIAVYNPIPSKPWMTPRFVSSQSRQRTPAERSRMFEAGFGVFAGNSAPADRTFSQLVLALSGGTSFSVRRYLIFGTSVRSVAKLNTFGGNPPSPACKAFPRLSVQGVHVLTCLLSIR
jgi:hypothetical protein